MPPPPPADSPSSAPPPPASTKAPVAKAKAPVPATKAAPIAKAAPTKLAPPRNRLPTLDLGDDDIVEDVPPPPPRTSTMPPPVPRAARPIDAVREAVGELEFFATPWQAAGVCAAALAKALRAGAVLVHLYDAKRRELRTIAVEVARPHDLLGSTAAADDDLVASAVTVNKKPMTLRFDGGLPRSAPARLRTVDAKRSLVAVPAIASGACVAVIEVVDATDPNAKALQEACAFVAERLAKFLASRRAA